MAADPEFGQEVRALLDDLGLNPYSASKRCGYIPTHQTIRHWAADQLPRDGYSFLVFVRTLKPDAEHRFRELLERRYFAPA